MEGAIQQLNAQIQGLAEKLTPTAQAQSMMYRAFGELDEKRRVQMAHDALAIDPNVDPDNRLPNLISQKRARWLLTRSDDLFIE